ncbi:hypothetical protein [Wolbachia endosymbiont of Ctenocephalides felis wCfeT]|uniref:hypothetical protein n=1 Tax=Wolbachia endosymbiont of Ctenocephalides felis wCfeT TaxID=2732593 RepID=UPI001445F65D|nr:hypothetical protein [Wolbachia endosymbiont of Ctenocephalides felis wCfeT]
MFALYNEYNPNIAKATATTASGAHIAGFCAKAYAKTADTPDNTKQVEAILLCFLEYASLLSGCCASNLRSKP